MILWFIPTLIGAVIGCGIVLTIHWLITKPDRISQETLERIAQNNYETLKKIQQIK